MSSLQDRFDRLKCCVVIPTYNNEKTVGNVITDTLGYTSNLIVVCDGATDSTPQILDSFKDKITVVHYSPNKGKGNALRTAFKEASKQGYEYTIAIDSDAQHFPSDFSHFLDALEANPESLIIGARNLNSENVPGKSSFGNKFSNFWTWVETGKKLPDTQSGYRLYPIKKLEKLTFFTTKFEFEIEVLVRAIWSGIKVVSIPIQVYYAKPGERVSHFIPSRDSTRISILNTALVFVGFLWFRPVMHLRELRKKNFKELLYGMFFGNTESTSVKALSVGVGVFFGIIPIWGYQLVSAIATAYFLRLNKAIVILTANISAPPFIPFILWGSIKTGEFVLGEKSTFTVDNITLENVKNNLLLYGVGASVLALLAALVLGVVAYFLLLTIKPKN